MEQEKKAIDSLMSETRTFPPPAELTAEAWVKSMEQYQAMYDRSVNDPDGFWLEKAEEMVVWSKKPTVAREHEWNTEGRTIQHTWFRDGQLNVAYNCLDRHLGTERENKVALIWQGDEPDEDRQITYKE
ncbi:MAG: acetyl-coenzyme A synthetase, partial [Candidatus Brocadiae bacterium]|nr:acetyl-coenzyme A synthetase [Candidatus Brocadiia bacterium]